MLQLLIGNIGHGCTQAPRQFTKTLTLRANDLNQVRAVKDAISRHLEQRGGVDHMLPRGCELDTLDDGTAKLSITVRPLRSLPYHYPNPTLTHHRAPSPSSS